MNKRGMSPLVATLLLIAFAVAIGVVIINFGSAQVEMEAECPISIGLKISEVAEKEQLCLDKTKNQLFLIVENGVNIKVEGLIINVIGAKKVFTYELAEAKLEKAGNYMKYLTYSLEEYGEIRQLKIIPKVKLYDEEVICQEKAIVLEEIRDC